MRRRGVIANASWLVFESFAFALFVAVFSAWPNSGAGLDTGDHRGALRVVVQVDAHASIDVQASLEGRA
ncbi:hypothetical protein K3179_10570 [Qipengyuania sp. GH38]|uniref:hypothetical protein n=1 Tax=Qipengyuania intermedia TaxID=2867244 RepID=UPI001C86F699|nr:hypothetical protein [Qipengyuania intermedia]MBX7514984.1 hypothetical protein [Qipengyuania intermedia]